MKTFSIVTPIFASTPQKVAELVRNVESVANQINYPLNLVEHIIVNDGSTIPVDLPKYPHVKVLNQENMQRMTAYNTGLSRTKNEIICMLDADDEFVPNTLEKINAYYENYPNYPLFNFGCIYHHKDGGITTRDAFRPKNKAIGHEVFGGGNIVNGTFVFRRDVYDTLGAFPPSEVRNIDCTAINYGGIRNLNIASPYDFSAYAQMEYPEIRQFFMVDVESEPHKVIKELGNPFGQDFYLFYKYTRMFHSKPMKDHLVIVHLR